MKCHVFLALMLSAFALVGRPAAAAWVYEPFPPIPHSTVVTNTYVSDFVAICAGFEKRCASGGTRTGEAQAICDAAPASGATAVAELAATGDQVFAATEKSWVYFASSIRQVCGSIAVGRALTDEQLAELRRNGNHRHVLFEVAGGESVAQSVEAAKGIGRAQSPAVPLAALPGFEGLQGRLIQGLADFLASEPSKRHWRS